MVGSHHLKETDNKIRNEERNNSPMLILKTLF